MQHFKKLYLFLISLIFSVMLNAQIEKVKPVIFDGFIAFGYVNNGGYVNFAGPGLNATYKNSKFSLGLLPSLRFKEDNGQTKNATVFPSLGFGFSYSYKYFTFQLPMYYNVKTPLNNGRWHLGIGVGFRINVLNRVS